MCWQRPTRRRVPRLGTMRAHLRAATIVCISVLLLPMFGWSAPPKDTCTPCIDRLFSQAPPAMRGPVTLRAAFDAISKASGVPVRGLWISIVPEGGLDPERMVQIDGNPASCGALLNTILDQVSEPTNPALWQCTSGGIEAGSRTALWRPQAMRVQVYDMRDLLLRVPAFKSTGVPQAGAAGSGGSGGSGGSSGSGGSTGSTTTDADKDARRTLRMDELMKLIQATVVPEAWEAQGGPCTMAPRDGMLVVRAPDFVHRQIEQPRPPRRAASKKPSAGESPKSP